MRATSVWACLIVAMLCMVDIATAASPPTADAPRHLYDRVMEEFKRGDYEAALAGFRLVIELHRDSPLAASAQYWIGECQYRLGRYQDALEAFYKVSSYKPQNPKLAASAFKIGQTYSKLGDHQRARLMFDRVLDQYPNGAEAELARKALSSLSHQE